ncbi:amidohydrolase-domain-containing protein [Xylariaceae sp. FL1019]|nr:amidohydrolase-domain-containing protein [Xylariaceae sp. FL1019]
MPPLEKKQKTRQEPGDFGFIHSVIDACPIVDNHAHPLLRAEWLYNYPLLSIASEAHGDALEDSKYSLAHIRATNILAEILGCEPEWNAVEAAIVGKQITNSEAWTRVCLDGIETILVDDGLDGQQRVEPYSWLDSFTRSKCKRIVRIEALAEYWIVSWLRDLADVRTSSLAEHLLEKIRFGLAKCLEDPEVVGFKSVICYRGGLDIPSANDISKAAARDALSKLIDNHRSGANDFIENKRLQHPAINHYLIHLIAQMIRDHPVQLKKPIQFHTGLGDNDIGIECIFTLTKSSPSHMQTFIREYPTVPIVILHASYPWTREAGYLAAMYKNVYADIGEVFPFLSQHGQESVIKQILELCPWSKILWSTDGHWFPETYLVLSNLPSDGITRLHGKTRENSANKRPPQLSDWPQFNEKQAYDLVYAIMFKNSEKLYDLRSLETKPPTYEQARQDFLATQF